MPCNTEKYCYHCDKTKSQLFFPKKKNKFTTPCKECKNILSRIHYIEKYKKEEVIDLTISDKDKIKKIIDENINPDFYIVKNRVDKKCIKCNQIKILSDFEKEKRTCKICIKELKEKTKEKIRIEKKQNITQVPKIRTRFCKNCSTAKIPKLFKNKWHQYCIAYDDLIKANKPPKTKQTPEEKKLRQQEYYKRKNQNRKIRKVEHEHPGFKSNCKICHEKHLIERRLKYLKEKKILIDENSDFSKGKRFINKQLKIKKFNETKELKCTRCNEIKDILCFTKKTKYSYDNKCKICKKILYGDNWKKNQPKYKDLPIYQKIRGSISRSINKKLKQNGNKKNGSISKYLNYTMLDLKSHLEKQFESWMTWENRGVYNPKIWNDNDQSTWSWQLDHIVPHSTFKYMSMEDELFKQCWALENLRPLSAKQNVLDGTTKIRHKKEYK